MAKARVMDERRENRIAILKSMRLKSLKTLHEPEHRTALMTLFALLQQISAQFKNHLAWKVNVSTL